MLTEEMIKITNEQLRGFEEPLYILPNDDKSEVVDNENITYSKGEKEL